MWRPPKIPFSPGQALFQSQHASVESTTQRKAYSFNWQTSNGSLFSPSQALSLCSAVALGESPLTCNDKTVHMRGSRRGTQSWGCTLCSPQFSSLINVDFFFLVTAVRKIGEIIVHLWSRYSFRAEARKYEGKLNCPWWVEMCLSHGRPSEFNLGQFSCCSLNFDYVRND